MSKKIILFAVLIAVIGVIGYKISRPSVLSGSTAIPTTTPSTTPSQGSLSLNEFKGNKGEKVTLENGEILLQSSLFADNQAKFYNVDINQKTIYFFVVKDKNGVYRAAANSCQVCFSTKKGFHQEGDFIVCNNCGNRYPLEKIATEKGGCNPAPINPNLEVKNGNLIIKSTDLQNVAEFF